MKLIRRLLFALAPMLVTGLFITHGAMAEPDAPRSCTTNGADAYGVEVEVEETPNSTIFTYFIDSPGVNPDHAVLAMDCVEECAPSTCSVGNNSCSTDADCTASDQDVCVHDSECVLNFGSPDNNGTDLNDCGGNGDRVTDLGIFMDSRATLTANPKIDTSSFFVEIEGKVTCDSGDIAIKEGKSISYCEICAPLTSLDQGPGAFANTEKIVTIGNCRFSRVFERDTGKLLSSEVLGTADPNGPPCEGIVVSTDQDPQSGTFGQLVAKGVGDGTVPPMPFNNLQFNVGDGGVAVDFGLGLQDQAGGNEWTSGSGTCVTLSDGFGGTSLSCTCQKPFSKGETKYCGK